jgi:dATP pyrophosphohydrolase
MARAPFQVLVYPCRQVGDEAFKYALLKRSVQGFWQAVTGGGEGSETPLETASRETFEETGIPPDSVFLQLDTVEPIPVTAFKDSHLWGEDVYVVPQYCFGVLVEDERLYLSREHTAYRWLEYEEAQGLLKYDGDKTALWELDARLRGLGPRG